MKLIIAISKSLTLHGHCVRKFRYMSAHKVHVWEGRELSGEEFNKVSKAVFHENSGLHPFALVVSDEAVAQVVAPASVESPAPVAPVVDAEKEELKARVADLEAKHAALAEEYGSLLAALNPPTPVNPAAIVLATPAVQPAKSGGKRGGKA